jgi:hypothetical protein
MGWGWQHRRCIRGKQTSPLQQPVLADAEDDLQN